MAKKIKNCKKPGLKGEPHYINEIPEKYIQMFHNKIQVQPNGCHHFKSAVQNTGYCNWYYNRESDNRTRYITAHKFGALISGKFTEDQINDYCVLHSCDQNYDVDDITYRQCVNPDHLWSGTVKDNMQDCIKKGRYKKPPSYCGEENYNSTITEKQAKFIIENHYVISQRKLSEIIGCHVTTIQQIHSNKTWRHLPRPKHA